MTLRLKHSALALACPAPRVAATAGFMGTSKGRADLEKHGELARPSDSTARGDVALTGHMGGPPSGSVAPLVWAQGEYVKVFRSLTNGEVFDMSQDGRDGRAHAPIASPVLTWRPGEPAEPVPSGKTVRVALNGPGTVEWTTNNWASPTSTPAVDVGVGVFYADVGGWRAVRRVRLNLDKAQDGERREAIFASEAL